MARETYSKPTDVTSENGRVILDGPDGVDVAMTPEAALETGGRLIDEAAVAAGKARAKKQDEEARRPK